MPDSKKRHVVNVKIKEFASNGHGLSQLDQEESTIRDVEVPFTIPGDNVSATLLAKKGDHWTSQVNEILTPSPDRIESKCIHFGSCGGCQWQQMSYETQLHYKENAVREYSKSFIGSTTQFMPIMGSDPIWQYRNKMVFTFSSDLNKHKYLGLFLNNSKGKIFNLQECYLVNPWHARAVQAVKEWWEENNLEAYHPIRDTGSLRTLTLREGIRTGDRMVILTVSGNPDYALESHHLESFTRILHQAIQPDLPNARLSIFMRIQQISPGTETNFYEMLLYGPDHIEERLEVPAKNDTSAFTLRYSISPTTFFQPNVRQIEKLYPKLIEIAKMNKNTILYDLYCAGGAFSVYASKFVKEVIGIDMSSEAILDAKQNVTLNDAHNFNPQLGAVRYVLNELQADGSFTPPDVIHINSPRSGPDQEAMRQLIRLSPSKILFFSCNLKTHSACIKQFVDNGYEVKLVQPIDQFPHTHHVDTLIYLEKTHA